MQLQSFVASPDRASPVPRETSPGSLLYWGVDVQKARWCLEVVERAWRSGVLGGPSVRYLSERT